MPCMLSRLRAEILFCHVAKRDATCLPSSEFSPQHFLWDRYQQAAVAVPHQNAIPILPAILPAVSAFLRRVWAKLNTVSAVFFRTEVDTVEEMKRLLVRGLFSSPSRGLLGKSPVRPALCNDALLSRVSYLVLPLPDLLFGSHAFSIIVLLSPNTP